MGLGKECLLKNKRRGNPAITDILTTECHIFWISFVFEGYLQLRVIHRKRIKKVLQVPTRYFGILRRM